MLVAVFSERESYAVYFLSQQDISRFDIVNYISHGIAKVSEGEHLPGPEPEQDDTGEEDDQSSGALESFTINLNRLAEQERIDPLVGRSKEIERTIQILCRRRKNNPL